MEISTSLEAIKRGMRASLEAFKVDKDTWQAPIQPKKETKFSTFVSMLKRGSKKVRPRRVIQMPQVRATMRTRRVTIAPRVLTSRIHERHIYATVPARVESKLKMYDEVVSAPIVSVFSSSVISQIRGTIPKMSPINGFLIRLGNDLTNKARLSAFQPKYN